VHPWADVTAGDRDLGRTPLEGVSLEPGRVVLLMQNPEYWPLHRLVTLEPGRRTRLQIDLQWEGIVRGKAPPYQVPSSHSPDDPFFVSGVRYIVLGDLQEAVVTLEPVVKRLQGRGRPKELAQAEFFLGVAQLELGREVEARASFESALGHDDSLRLRPDAFPTRVRTFFGHVRDAIKEKKR
jgi:hypothetical protein